MSYGTPYIDIPLNRKKAVGRTLTTMSKTSNIAEPSKPAKKYSKTRGEHYKDLVIVALVVGIVAFVGGMHFANQHNAETAKAVQAATVQTTTKK